MEILAVSEARWYEAQQFEARLWVRGNQRNSYITVAKKLTKALKKPKLFFSYLCHGDFYCGDDWNYWWRNAFDCYGALPKMFDRAVEVGCGPYTNIRLISHGRQLREIHCADPLIRTYQTFRMTWLSHAIKRSKVKLCECKGEALNYQDRFFDLAVCINVLDHVEDAGRCITELLRVTRPGGYLVLGQDLTNEEDLLDSEVRNDVGHPIKITHDTLDKALRQSCRPILRKVLPRGEGRNPNAHYGTYIYIGQLF